jgi:iron complex transport system substrate-binding protein
MTRKVSRAIRTFLLAGLAILLIAACNGKLVNVSHTPNMISRSSPSTGCRMIQHVMGETCVPDQPKRLVTLNPAALGNAIALGIQPIGSIFEYNNQFPEYLEGKTEGIEPLGDWSQPSIERIALLKPDVIIGWQHNHQSIYPQLSTIAPTVFYDWKGNNKLQDNWKEYFNFMAEVLDRKKAEEQVWQHYDQRTKQLRTALGDRYKNKRISFVIFCCGGIVSEPENSFIGSIFSDVGLQLVESQKYNPQGFVKFSEEALELIDGDVMFVIAYGGNETGEHNLKMLQQKPLWKKLKVVQQNRVYYVNPTTWRARTPLAADAVIDDLYKYLINTP